MNFMARVVPITEKVVAGSLTGANLKEIMEQGLSNCMQLDGRWPVISGFKFEYDPSQAQGERIIPGTFKTEADEHIIMDKVYTLAAPYWLFAGRDGYTAFLKEGISLEENHPEEAPTMQDIVYNWFVSFSKSQD